MAIQMMLFAVVLGSVNSCSQFCFCIKSDNIHFEVALDTDFLLGQIENCELLRKYLSFVWI